MECILGRFYPLANKGFGERDWNPLDPTKAQKRKKAVDI
jgi:hypothetical protein